MSFLGHFFADDATLASDLSKNEQLLRQSISRYSASSKHRQEIIERLKNGQCTAHDLDELSLTLADELALLAGEEQEERDVTQELESFETHVRQFEHLYVTMNHVASKEKYAYHLMKQLYDLLRDTAFTVVRLKKRFAAHEQSDDLQQLLIEQVTLEQRMESEISTMREQFHAFYVRLAQGARRKHELEAHEQEIADDIYERMLESKTADPDSTSEHHISQLTDGCFQMLEQEVMQAVIDDKMEQHAHVIFEFVNSPHFEEMVRREIQQRRLGMSETETKSFILIFRDLYNSRIESGRY